MLSRAGAGASASLPSITIIVASLQCFAFLPGGNLAAASFPALLQLPPYRLNRSWPPAPSSAASRRINANRPIDWEEQEECSSFGEEGEGLVLNEKKKN